MMSDAEAKYKRLFSITQEDYNNVIAFIKWLFSSPAFDYNVMSLPKGIHLRKWKSSGRENEDNNVRYHKTKLRTHTHSSTEEMHYNYPEQADIPCLQNIECWVRENACPSTTGTLPTALSIYMPFKIPLFNFKNIQLQKHFRITTLTIKLFLEPRSQHLKDGLHFPKNKTLSTTVTLFSKVGQTHNFSSVIWKLYISMES